MARLAVADLQSRSELSLRWVAAENDFEKSLTRCRGKDRVLDILYRRRTMIAGHFQQFRCLLQIAFERLDSDSG